MNKQKTIFFLIGIAFISIFAIVYFSFNAPREDISSERGLDLWVVADRIRKCAALNSIQIAHAECSSNSSVTRIF